MATRRKKGGKKLRLSVVDGLALLVGIIQPLMTLPQIILVLQAQDASQISFWTWATYNVASVVLLVYGLMHRLVAIIVAQLLWLVVQTIMIILVFTLS